MLGIDLLLGATKLPGKHHRLVCTAPTLPSVLHTSVVFDVWNRAGKSKSLVCWKRLKMS